ncbi:MAG: M3 family oligoendopeptidase [Saprospiraceae bacterium]|nr:M3 family oligoendopeptidase [Saprospiraceae bacterium]
MSIKNWEDLEPIYQELQARAIPSVEALEAWIVDRNALEIAVYEEFGWRYIRLTTNTQHEAAIKEYEYFVQQISPKASAYEFQLNKKLFDSPYAPALNKEQYRIYLRDINNSSRLFREENVALIAEERLQAKHYGTLFSKIVIPFQAVDLTLQQALGKLEESDRATREQAFKLVHSNLQALTVEVERIFDDLRAIRLKIANQANFDNYRDYRFQHLGRFDYSSQDCLNFHESIKTTIVPIVTTIHERRKRNLQLEELRPWDLNVDPMAQAPLQPFNGEQELMEKSIRLLHELHPLLDNVSNGCAKQGIWIWSRAQTSGTAVTICL